MNHDEGADLSTDDAFTPPGAAAQIKKQTTRHPNE